MRSDSERLLDILEAIGRIEEHAPKGRTAFNEDEMLQVWMVHHLRIIGEAARQVSDETRSASPDIPWSQIIGMRNLLVHQYHRIDEDVVWSVIERDVPQLRRQVEALLEQLDPGSDISGADDAQ